MSRNVVKCPWKKFVEIPADASVVAGDDCICPSCCPNYKRPQRDCSYGRFNAKNSSTQKDDPISEVYAYAPEEISRQFPKRADAGAPQSRRAGVSAEQPRQQERILEQSAAEHAATPPTAPSSGRGSATTYTFPIFGSAPDSAPAQASETGRGAQKRKAGDGVLKPARQYDVFELRGVYYSLNERDNARCLSDATQQRIFFRRLLETFDVESVMDGRNFKDNFLWVLDNTLAGERRSRAAEVLNAEVLSGAERFFMLFYYAIFYDKPQLSLYWASGYTCNLRPIYNEVGQFYRKIASGNDRFYEEHAEAVLLWLRKITLSEWADEDKKREHLRTIQEKVAVESIDDIVFFWEAQHKFVCLGNKETFVRELIKSDKPIKTLEATAVFLSRFDIVLSGGKYRVVPRSAPDREHVKNIGNDEINDDIMCRLFSSDRLHNKAELYLYIVERYCKLFNPSAVTIGGVTFNRGTYSEQIEESVDQMFAYILGDAATDEQRRTAHTAAILAKLLYQKGVLFECARDVAYMNRLLGNVSPSALREASAAKAYFTFCKEYGRADKIMLFSYDYSALPHKARFLRLLDFMKKRIQSVDGTAALSALLKAPVFAVYKEVFCAGASGWREIDNYRAIEKKALKIVENLRGGGS